MTSDTKGMAAAVPTLSKVGVAMDLNIIFNLIILLIVLEIIKNIKK